MASSRGCARLLVASFTVIVGGYGGMAVLAASGVAERFPVVTAVVVAGLFVGLTVAALVLFNPWWANPLGLLKPDDILWRLEAEGLLIDTHFRAKRAFAVAEYDDEGLHLFLELDDGRVLFLSGPYLYDYEPGGEEDDGGEPLPRRFPCTAFTIRRHRTEGLVVEIVCHGQVLEPEFLARPFPRQKSWTRPVPTDGEVIEDVSYDELRVLFGGDAPDRG